MSAEASFTMPAGGRGGFAVTAVQTRLSVTRPEDGAIS
jgi:hypothetical protein